MAKHKKNLSDTRSAQKKSGIKTGESTYDPFASSKRTSHVAWPWLTGIFIVVWLIVIYLMAPSFTHDYRRYMSIRYQKTDPAKSIAYLQKLREEALAKAKLQAKLDKVNYDENTMDNPTYCLEIGTGYFNLGQYQEALKWYEKAQACRENTTSDDTGKKIPPYDFSSTLATCYYKLGQFDKATKYFQAALDTNPKLYGSILTWAKMEIDQGKYKEALAHLKMIASEPEYAASARECFKQISDKLFANLDLDGTQTLVSKSTVQ